MLKLLEVIKYIWMKSKVIKGTVLISKSVWSRTRGSIILVQVVSSKIIIIHP
jgi:hypothetical protein